MIYVTHDQVEAMTMASRIVVLNKGQIEQVGTPLELYANPLNRFVAGFLGSPRMNFVEGVVERSAPSELQVALKGTTPLAFTGVKQHGLAVGDTVTVGVRPEKLTLVSEGSARNTTFAAKIGLVEYLGRETVVYADASPLHTVGSDTGTHNFTIQMASIVPLSTGAPVVVGFDVADAYLFDQEGRTLSPDKPFEAKK
jgi:multiple sugar transport system ATP-binding protein